MRSVKKIPSLPEGVRKVMERTKGPTFIRKVSKPPAIDGEFATFIRTRGGTRPDPRQTAPSSEAQAPSSPQPFTPGGMTAIKAKRGGAITKKKAQKPAAKKPVAKKPLAKKQTKRR